MNEVNLISLQKKLNEKLAILLKENGIKNLQLTSLGNSIASGYSLARITKPLLLRNETIDIIMKQYNIDYNTNFFSRPQNNNDEHIFSWIISNEKQSSINRMNRADYKTGHDVMKTNNLDDELFDLYYPENLENDIGLQDIVLKNNIDLANIIIYNGCTGSFLDNVTRKGKYKFTYGIKRDVTSLEATLKFIQENNRFRGTNTQVYICGAPNFLGLGIVEIINSKLKKLCEKYANAVYVEPAKANFVYQLYTGKCDKKSFLDKIKKIRLDIHYHELEYLQLNNNILNAIINNYLLSKDIIELDRYLFKLSTSIEMCESLNIDEQKQLFEIMLDEKNRKYDVEQKRKFMKRLKDYITERAPYDFYYAGKSKIYDIIK